MTESRQDRFPDRGDGGVEYAHVAPDSAVWTRELEDLSATRRDSIFGVPDFGESVLSDIFDLGGDDLAAELTHMFPGAQRLHVAIAGKKLTDALRRREISTEDLVLNYGLPGEALADDMSVDVAGDSFAEWLARHSREFAERTSEMRERLPGYVVDYADRAHEAISSGVIPISHEELERRLGLAELCILDELTASLKPNAYGKTGVLGEYCPVRHLGFVRENLKPGRERHTVFHELTHAISGRTMLSYGVANDRFRSFATQRLGLRFGGYTIARQSASGFGRQLIPLESRFVWLNEAVAEDTALTLLDGVGDDDLYPADRELVRALLRCGKEEIPASLLRQAYFEDYQPDSADPIPHWRAFKHALTRAYDATFLRDIERIKCISTEDATIAVTDLSRPGSEAYESTGQIARATILSRGLYESGLGVFSADIRRFYGLPEQFFADLLSLDTQQVARIERGDMTASPGQMLWEGANRLREQVALFERAGIRRSDVAEALSHSEVRRVLLGEGPGKYLQSITVKASTTRHELRL